VLLQAELRALEQFRLKLLLVLRDTD